ncbi:hypothetical protein BKA70DRAFT_1435480 [Coprinopsis sp. MPI-PUGE-AT-0042]|nr:hypothetical protein BKA70DRAFT_1435480 [Coprinopsis sp. MPI-PUGE-AT-0042]
MISFSRSEGQHDHKFLLHLSLVCKAFKDGIQLRGLALLPGLLHLIISDLRFCAANLLPLILHPRLERLEILDTALAEPHILTVVLPSLPELTAGLKHLRIHKNDFGFRYKSHHRVLLPRSALEILKKFSAIESVEIRSPKTILAPDLHEIFYSPDSKEPCTIRQYQYSPQYESPRGSASTGTDAGSFSYANANLMSITLTFHHDRRCVPEFLAQKATSLIIVVSAGLFPPTIR